MSTPGDRQKRVADIIVDYWPHRMSGQAAESIDGLYIRLGFSDRPVLRDVDEERIRQDSKWGPQNHPDGTSSAQIDQSYRDAVRNRCDGRFERGVGTWKDILLEEVFEALAEDDPAKLREELVQVAAVAVAWIEAIDRRG